MTLAMLASMVLWAQASPATPAAERFAERLAALSPDDARAYFNLGEEVAAEAWSDADFALARTLFVLAFEIDRAGGGGAAVSSGVGASVCLALADLEPSEAGRAWLWALAGTLDPQYAQPDWGSGVGLGAGDEAAIQAATLLGLVRSGDGAQARELFRRPEVGAIIETYERLLGTGGESGGVARLERAMGAWPCPQCHNRRVVTRRGGPPEDVLCPTCNGNPGPQLSRAELLAQLRFESRLLNGIQRSWAAQITVDQGAPLRDPSPDELAPTYGVDPRATLWRDAGWTRPEGEAPRDPGADAPSDPGADAGP